jgi:hypothetical protein
MIDDIVYRARPWLVTLVLHNWPVLLYAAAIPWVAIYALWRPGRRPLLLLYGLATLALAFEYEKHGLSVMRETTSYLFPLSSASAVRRVSQMLLLDVMPLAMRVAGAALVLLAAIWPLFAGRSAAGARRGTAGAPDALRTRP